MIDLTLQTTSLYKYNYHLPGNIELISIKRIHIWLQIPADVRVTTYKEKWNFASSNHAQDLVTANRLLNMKVRLQYIPEVTKNTGNGKLEAHSRR